MQKEKQLHYRQSMKIDYRKTNRSVETNQCQLVMIVIKRPSPVLLWIGNGQLMINRIVT